MKRLTESATAGKKRLIGYRGLLYQLLPFCAPGRIVFSRSLIGALS